MTNLGIIVRSDLGSGLQSQTYSLTRLLKPSRVMIVNSTSFNGNDQHDYLYDGFEVQKTMGWPTNLECARFMKGLTHVLTSETAYNPKIYDLARLHGVKVFTQPNWEFLDHINNRRMLGPSKWLMPSLWKNEDMRLLFSNVEYLPPPIFMNDFKKARDKNLSRSGKKRFVHIMGKAASHDRNGTFDLIDALKYSTSSFDLVIKSQFEVPEYTSLVNDQRVSFDIQNVEDPEDLYKGFDAMIMPRRYGGLCLPMNEALSSALPVIMPDISPNNLILPKDWLVPASVDGSFMARTRIEIHKSDHIFLGKLLDRLCIIEDRELEINKLRAYEIAYDNYSSDLLRDRYKKVMDL